MMDSTGSLYIPIAETWNSRSGKDAHLGNTTAVSSWWRRAMYSCFAGVAESPGFTCSQGNLEHLPLCSRNPASMLESPEVIKNSRMPGSRHFHLMSTQGWQARTAWALRLPPWNPRTKWQLSELTTKTDNLNNLKGCLLPWVFHVYCFECVQCFLFRVSPLNSPQFGVRERNLGWRE